LKSFAKTKQNERLRTPSLSNEVIEKAKGEGFPRQKKFNDDEEIFYFAE
jgi:hypothetical protein